MAILEKFGSLIYLGTSITEGCIRARPTTEEAERSDIREETSKRFSTPSSITGLIGKIIQCQQVKEIIKLTFEFYLPPMDAKFSRILHLQIQPRVCRLELRHCVAHWPLWCRHRENVKTPKFRLNWLVFGAKSSWKAKVGTILSDSRACIVLQWSFWRCNGRQVGEATWQILVQKCAKVLLLNSICDFSLTSVEVALSITSWIVNCIVIYSFSDTWATVSQRAVPDVSMSTVWPDHHDQYFAAEYTTHGIRQKTAVNASPGAAPNHRDP